MDGWIADPNSIEYLARVLFAALLDRFKHGFPQKVVSRLDVDCYNATFIFSFELRF